MKVPAKLVKPAHKAPNNELQKNKKPLLEKGYYSDAQALKSGKRAKNGPAPQNSDESDGI